MTPLLTFVFSKITLIIFALTGSVLFLLGWTLGFSYGLKRGSTRGIFGQPASTLRWRNSNRSFMSWLDERGILDEDNDDA